MMANHADRIRNVIDKRTENGRTRMTLILKTYETWNKTNLSVVGT